MKFLNKMKCLNEFWFWWDYVLPYHITNLLIWLIKKVHPGKDRVLSQQLFDLAEDYNTRPRTFNYHSLAPEKDWYL